MDQTKLNRYAQDLQTVRELLRQLDTLSDADFKAVKVIRKDLRMTSKEIYQLSKLVFKGE
ncbi:hypothetical protein [Secundilactobacillus kimchicus]|uniref:hypothetical protein n=1 Tax=Secundilactobacillus kimchicus TaxID=528209 RepID=UPI0024A8C1A4|nr:hypothetical protein [Secundilactobacillus kimchicus]